MDAFAYAVIALLQCAILYFIVRAAMLSALRTNRQEQADIDRGRERARKVLGDS